MPELKNPNCKRGSSPREPELLLQARGAPGGELELDIAARGGLAVSIVGLVALLVSITVHWL